MTANGSSGEPSFIGDQLKRAVEGDAWHGPSVIEAMALLDSVRACRVSTTSGHSPCQIVLHIAAWLEIVRDRMQGKLVSPTSAQDWPKVKGSPDAAWTAAERRVRSAHEALAATVSSMHASELQAIVPGKQYDVRFMLHGVIQHTLYHAGQVALIARLADDAV